MTQQDVTVYIGRFNPFHLGHVHILERALKTSKLVIVLIGSSGLARSLKNPFTYEERRDMIVRWYNTSDSYACQLVILPLRDFPYANNLWIKSVQAKVADTVKQHNADYGTSLSNIHLTGSDRDDSTWYLSAFPQWKMDLVDPHVAEEGVMSGTSVREVLYNSLGTDADYRTLESKLPSTTISTLKAFDRTGGLDGLRQEFAFVRKYKQSWASAPYAPTFVTADAVIIQSGHVLVVKRGAQPGKGLWALPGGFVKQRQLVKECAVDEAMEETGLRLAEGKRWKEITKSMLLGSIRAMELFDNPDRSARGRTITTAYLMRLDDTKPLPKVSGQFAPLEDTGGVAGVVETDDAFWLPLDIALSETWNWFEDHHSILEWAAAQKD